MDTIKICDSNFIHSSKSAGVGGENKDLSPKYFEWVYEEDPLEARFVTDGHIKHARGKGQVALLLEPYGLHPENYDVANERKHEFDAVLAHSGSGVFDFRWYPLGGSRIPSSMWGYRNKKGLVSLLLSDKTSMPGHKLRHAVEEKYGDRIDVFRDIESKMEALAVYKYSIIIESEREEVYFTEKLIDCLCLFTIPIYWGPRSIGKYFNTDSIIQVNGLDEIGGALDIIGEADYLNRSGGCIHNFDLVWKYAVCEDNFYEMYPELFK